MRFRNCDLFRNHVSTTSRAVLGGVDDLLLGPISAPALAIDFNEGNNE